MSTVTTDQITSFCAQAQAAIAKKDYSTAINKLLQVQALLISLPNLTKDYDAVGWNNSRIMIDSLLVSLRTYETG